MENYLSDDLEADDGKSEQDDDEQYNESKEKNILDNIHVNKPKINETEYNDTTKRKLGNANETDVDGKIDIVQTIHKLTRSFDHQDLIPVDSDEPQFNYPIWSTISQITATLILNFLNFNYGMVVIMPTLLVGTLDSVTATNETRIASPQLILNDMHASWLGSILMLFHPLGAVVSGHLQEILGRKSIMFSVNIPFLLSWVALSTAQHIPTLYAASIVMGVSLGMCEAPLASYIGEISEPKLRGAISLLTGFASSVGALVIYVLYTYTSWRTCFLLSGVIPSISLCVIGLLPESPVYLVSKNRPDEARKSLRWLRGWIGQGDTQLDIKQNIEAELQTLIRITHDSNVLFINTKVSQGYCIGNKEKLNAYDTEAIDMECFLKEHNDTIRLIDKHKGQRETKGDVHTKRKQSVKFNTNAENDEMTFVIEQKKGVTKSNCTNNGLAFTKKNRNVHDLKKLNANNRDLNARHQSKLSSVTRSTNSNTEDFRNKRYTSNSIEEPLFTIVKVKHTKTLLNLVRYTIRNEEIRRPLLMVLTVVAITTIASLTPIRPFLMEIIQMYDDKMNTDDVLIATSVLNILGFFLCAVTINKLGKRRLAIISLAVNAVVSFTLGYFAYTHVSESRIPIYCIYINSFLQGYGILQLPWILMSEVFPLEIRGIACGLCAGSAYLLQFFFTKAYLSMTGVIGLASTICLYAMSGVLGILYIYFYMLETENKTLHQIQQHFLKR